MSTATLDKLAKESRYTPEDLLIMPDGDQYELVNGQLVEISKSLLSIYVAGSIFRLVRSFCLRRQLGWVFPQGLMVRCFPADANRIRKPDVSFIAAGRLTQQSAREDGFAEVAPDLAVEVVSPNDLAPAVSRKVGEYLDAGVRLVWVVDPIAQSVAIHRHDRPGANLRASDTITGDDVLPGFQCEVSQFFELPPGTA